MQRTTHSFLYIINIKYQQDKDYILFFDVPYTMYQILDDRNQILDTMYHMLHSRYYILYNIYYTLYIVYYVLCIFCARYEIPDIKYQILYTIYYVPYTTYYERYCILYIEQLQTIVYRLVCSLVYNNKKLCPSQFIFRFVPMALIPISTVNQCQPKKLCLLYFWLQDS